MAIKSIWGFGGIYIRNDSISIQFPHAINELYFSKQNYRHKSISGKLYQTSVYYRPIIQANISICDSNDINKLKDLVNVLNFYTEDKLYIQAQYNTDNTQNIEYQCYLDSDQVRFEQLAQAQVGQTITLKFIGIQKLDQMPIHTSNSDIYRIVDNTDSYYIDQSGNYYIMQN